jgi:hypothetical protein
VLVLAQGWRAGIAFFAVTTWMLLLPVSTTARGRGFGVLWSSAGFGTLIPMETRNRQSRIIDHAKCGHFTLSAMHGNLQENVYFCNRL